MRESLIFFGLIILSTSGKLGRTETTSSSNITSSFISEFSRFNNTPFNLPSVPNLVRVNVLSFNELAVKYGHPAEQYEVTTEDGYILTIFRLRGGNKGLPVLLNHGLADSADTWIIRGNDSLSITLANDGRDVWLANNRGNRYARGHTFLNPDEPAFWNFTFHEMGQQDLAATIDFILNNTGASQLNAFGHSQGNTIFYVLLSTRPEYNAKINVMTALAPICYVHHVQPPFSLIFNFLLTFPRLYQTVTNLLGDDSIETSSLRTLSQIPLVGYLTVADLILFPIAGFDSAEFEPDFLPTVGRHFPTWISVKDLTHFSQMAKRKTFAQFDYGEEGNLDMYNSPTPPEYNLSKVVTKIVLLAGRNDRLSPLEDVDILRRQLPNLVQYEVNIRNKMNHIDYVWGRNMERYLYPYIFNVLDTFN